MRRSVLLGLALLVVSLGFTGPAAQRQPILGRMPPAPPADPNKPPPDAALSGSTVLRSLAGRTPTAFLNWVGRDVAEFWRKRVSAIPTARWLRGRQLVVAPGRVPLRVLQE